MKLKGRNSCFHPPFLGENKIFRKGKHSPLRLKSETETCRCSSMLTVPCLGMNFQKKQAIVSTFEKKRIRSTVAMMKYHPDKYTSMQIKQFCKTEVTWEKKCCILLRSRIMWTLIKKNEWRILFRVKFLLRILSKRVVNPLEQLWHSYRELECQLQG